MSEDIDFAKPRQVDEAFFIELWGEEAVLGVRGESVVDGETLAANILQIDEFKKVHDPRYSDPDAWPTYCVKPGDRVAVSDTLLKIYCYTRTYPEELTAMASGKVTWVLDVTNQADIDMLDARQGNTFSYLSGYALLLDDGIPMIRFRPDNLAALKAWITDRTLAF